MYKTLSAPLVVQVEVSSRCTNRCLHCYNFWRRSDEPLAVTDLSVFQMERVIQQLIEHGVFHVVFTGGEPLLNKQVLFRGLELAASCGVTTGINSSVVTLTKCDAERFKEFSVTSVLTSLMGPTATIHDGIAQQPKAFMKTLRGIRILQDTGVTVHVNMVVSQKNKAYVAETARFVKSLGVRHFSSTRAGCPGNCPDFSDLALNITEFREYLNTLCTVGEEAHISVGVLESYPLCGMGDMKKYKSFTGRRCLAGVTTVTVASDGTIRPCSHLDISYGNILKENLDEIWGRMVEWRDGSLLPEICRSCKALSWCGGGCRMEAKMRNGALNAQDPYVVPKDIDSVFTELTAPRGVKTALEVPEQLQLNPRARFRSEVFGGIVFIGPRLSCYLNHDAFAFVNSLRVERVCTLSYKDRKLTEQWRQFLGELYRRGVLVSAEHSASPLAEERRITVC